MIPDTVTVQNVAATDQVFSLATRLASESVYYAASPQGDLAGRLKLRIAHEVNPRTKVQRSLIQFVVPVPNGDGGYDSEITANLTLNRKTTAANAEVKDIVEFVSTFLQQATITDKIVEGHN